MPHADKRSFYIDLALFICALLALYAIGIFSRSIWFDEAITVQSFGAMPLTVPGSGFVDIAMFKPALEGTTTLPKVIEHYINVDIHPPLYFTVAHFATLVFGTNLYVVRFVSAALILLSVLIYARSLRRLEEPRIWTYLMVYGFSFAAATTAQDARGYAMAILLSMAAWHVLLLMAQKTAVQRRIPLKLDILLGVLCGSMLLTHYFALLAAIPLLGWRFLSGLWRRDIRCFVGPLVAIALFLPWLPFMLDHFGNRPNQMNGFLGVFEWIKRMAQFSPGLIFSITSPDVPFGMQSVVRRIVLLLLIIGTVRALWPAKEMTPRRVYGLIAVWVPAVGLLLFLAVSILMNRWFDTLRYLLFYAPFIIYLAALGALTLADGLAKLRPGRLAMAPVAVLIFAEVAMLNFGWEANRNRGGNYFNTWANDVLQTGTDESLVIIDVGIAYGNLLGAAYTLPPDTQAYLLDYDQATWTTAAKEIAPALDGKNLVVLAYTIDRGDIGDDKVALYGPVVKALEENGFVRAESEPAPLGQRFYAKWER